MRLQEVNRLLTDRRITVDVDDAAREWLANKGRRRYKTRMPSYCLLGGVGLSGFIASTKMWDKRYVPTINPIVCLMYVN